MSIKKVPIIDIKVADFLKHPIRKNTFLDIKRGDVFFVTKLVYLEFFAGNSSGVYYNEATKNEATRILRKNEEIQYEGKSFTFPEYLCFDLLTYDDNVNEPHLFHMNKNFVEKLLKQGVLVKS